VGSRPSPLPHFPLPRPAGEGEQKGAGDFLPRAYALGYFISPLTGLKTGDFTNQV